jgi:hypothetical protein
MERPFASISIAALALAACRTPTQVTVELSTDIPCSAGLKTTMQIGHPGQDVEDRPPTVETTACENGRIGSVVVVPSGAKDDEFAVKAVLAYDPRTPETCALAAQRSEKLPGCILARRAMRFVPHEELSLPMALLAECDGVLCPVNTTCLHGNCVPADPSVPPPPPPIGDAGSDAGTDIGTPVSMDASEEDGGFSCQAPGPLGMYRYVDPAAGTDDPAHGGNMGACAYRSLTYALSQTMGQIMLATATYSAQSGEAFPIVLRGDQKIWCSFGQGPRATIRGKGRYAPLATDATFVMEGNTNEIHDCIIDGGGGAGSCVDAVASGSQAAANIVQNADLGNCGDVGLQIENGVAGVWLFSSKVHGNRTGVLLLGGQDRCLLNQNMFSTNGTDIVCRDSGARVYGGFNGGEGGSKPTCQMCDSCPF